MFKNLFKKLGVMFTIAFPTLTSINTEKLEMPKEPETELYSPVINDNSFKGTEYLFNGMQIQEKKATQRYNVLDFKLKGNEELSDTEAIQRALNKAKNSNGIIEVYIPKGTYNIDSALNIFSNTIITVDENAVLKSSNGGQFIISKHLAEDGNICQGKDCPHTGYSQVENMVIQGGKWDCNGISQINLSGITLAHGNNIIIRDLEIANPAGHALNVSDSQNVLIENVTIKDQISSVPKKADDTNEVIHLDYAGSGEHGSTWGSYPIDGTPVNNVIIRNCLFYNVLSAIGSHTTAIGKETLGTNIIIENNLFMNVKCYAMNFLAHTDVEVINNRAIGYNPNNPISKKNEAYGFIQIGENLNTDNIGKENEDNLTTRLEQKEHNESGFRVYGNRVSGFEGTIVINDKNKTPEKPINPLELDTDVPKGDIEYKYYMIKYINGDENGDMSLQKVYDKAELMPCKFKKEGYKFAGWTLYRYYPGSSLSRMVLWQRWMAYRRRNKRKKIKDNNFE